MIALIGCQFKSDTNDVFSSRPCKNRKLHIIGISNQVVIIG